METVNSQDIQSVHIKYENLIITLKDGRQFYMRNTRKVNVLKTLFENREFVAQRKRTRTHLIVK